MRKLIFLTAVILCCVQYLSAQTLSKTGVVGVRLRSTGTVFQEGQVKGYYFFYNLEKQDRKNNNYQLSLYDENLRQINEVNVVRPRTYVLIDAVFNGTAFGFLFYDGKNKEVELIGYDKTLKQTGSMKRKISDRVTLAAYNAMLQGNDPAQAYLVAVQDKGFIYYGLQEAKSATKSQFDIQFYNNNIQKVWSKAAGADAMSIELGGEAFQDDQYVGSIITKKKNGTTKDIEFDLLVQNMNDGKDLFRIPMVTPKYSVSLADVYYDKEKQNFIVFGECYDRGAKELKSQSLGFITLMIDSNGRIVSEKVNTWQNEISKVTPVNEKGKFEGSNTNILFHDIIRTNDGHIFAVGEQYKTAASAAGIASQLLTVAAAASGGGGGYYGSSASAIQLNIYNMVIFEFDQDYNIKKVHMFEKDKNVVNLPSGAGYMSSKLLSYYAKAIGGFDYTFSQVSKDKSTFVVNYINYDREKGEKSKNVLGSIVYTPEKTFTVDKLVLNRKSSNYFVHRGKEGYILVTEYFKKEKRLDSRLEKINY